MLPVCRVEEKRLDLCWKPHREGWDGAQWCFCPRAAAARMVSCQRDNTRWLSAGGTVGRDGTGTSFVLLFLPREGNSFGLLTITSAGIFFIIIIIIIIIISYWSKKKE